MLNLLFKSQAELAAGQSVVAIVLALVTVWLARRQNIHLEQETIVSLARGLIQMIAVGLVLVLLLQGPIWTSPLVLAAMTGFAAATAARRARGVADAFRVSLYGIALGAGSIILLTVWLGVISPAVSSLIPIGSMLIANAMNSGALALERFRSDVASHTGQIEAALALGAEPRVTVRPYVTSAVQASLIPRIDTLRSLGIVWIPGLMAGMTLSGSPPVYAAVYQFVVIALIFASSGLTSLITTQLVRSRAFSPAEQLILRK